METTNKKECPKCKNPNVIKGGISYGAVVQRVSGTYPTDPVFTWYECAKCGEQFKVDNQNEDQK